MRKEEFGNWNAECRKKNAEVGMRNAEIKKAAGIGQRA
jgi:hypothetical protein